MKVHPYLNFPGNTEEAFNFYKSVFGGEFMQVVRFRDREEIGNVPAEELDKIMHISLPLGEDTILMATDALESMGHTVTKGDNTYIMLAVDSEEEADRIFEGLSKGGEVEMPMEKAFWGDYFGSFTDMYGIRWMINYSYGHSGN